MWSIINMVKNLGCFCSGEWYNKHKLLRGLYTGERASYMKSNTIPTNETQLPLTMSMLPMIILVGVTILLSIVLASKTVSADDNTSTVDQVNLTIPVSCTMSGTGMNSHNAVINNGLYRPDIGSTTLHAFCNDNEGFAIYAAGYTGDEIGGTNSDKLVGTSASGNAVIESGTATSAGNPDVSNWAMKLAIIQDSGDTTGVNAITLDNGFGDYRIVPKEYTKVAHKNSGTDMTDTTGGAKLTTTYAAYISETQPADTYSGQVKYTLVHPSDHDTPIANPATLDTGRVVNSKLKSLAATVVNEEETTITPTFDIDDDYDFDYAYDEYIKSINVHLKTPVPVGFTPSEKNTISSSSSKKPIYIVFDNTNDAGVMHFYTEGDQIFFPSDSSFMFYLFYELANLSALSDWDSSNVINMENMFFNTGSYASTFALNPSSWDTSNVTDMSYMFTSVGSSSTVFTLDVSSWDTSNVTDMSGMFSEVGSAATTWSIGDLASWETGNVIDMNYMFYSAGYSATAWSIGDISSWDTSNVTEMNNMFSRAGYDSDVFTLDLSSWNTSSLTSLESAFSYAGYNANTFALNLSSWNTSSVVSMRNTFYHTGRSATAFTLDLSSWNTSSTTNMANMFSNAGPLATTWTVTIPQVNGGGISNTTGYIYGKTTSVYGVPPSGKSFTFVQP